MGSLIVRVAETLVSKWGALPGFVRWAIQQIGGQALIDAVSHGVNAVISALSHFGSWAIQKIASLLGL